MRAAMNEKWPIFLKCLAVVVVLAGFLSGCANNSEKPGTDDPPQVFSTLELPADQNEADRYFTTIEEEVDAILGRILGKNEPDFDNTIAPLIHIRNLISQGLNLSQVMQNDAEDPALRTSSENWYRRLQRLSNDIDVNAELYARYRVASEGGRMLSPEERLDRESLFLNPRRLTDPENVQAYLQNLGTLTDLSVRFYLNAQTAPPPVVQLTPQEMACLSPEALELFSRDNAGNYLYEGHYFSSLMTSCLSDAVRARIDSAEQSRAAGENSLLWPQIVQARHALASQLGHADYASSQLEFNLLNSEEKVRAFLGRVEEATDPALQTMTDLYRQMQEEETGIYPDILTNWNWVRYSEMHWSAQREKLDDYRSDYLEHDWVLRNLLRISGDLFGLRFEAFELPGPLWSSSISGYRVYDTNEGKPLGTLLYDPLAGRSQAGIIESRHTTPDGVVVTPTVRLGLSFSSSFADSPYLTPYRYRALAHELGHAIHMLLSPRYYQNLGFEFIEMPSMFLETYAQQPAVLRALLSEDPLHPDSTFPAGFEDWWRISTNSGLDAMAQLRYGIAVSATAIDATSWRPGEDSGLGEVARKNLASYRYPYPQNAEPFYDAFHLIQPGYDTGYYLYLLGEVMAYDTVERFVEASDGPLSPEVGREYREAILERGIVDPQQAIRNFLGREMRFDAFEKHYQQMAEQW